MHVIISTCPMGFTIRRGRDRRSNPGEPSYRAGDCFVWDGSPLAFGTGPPTGFGRSAFAESRVCSEAQPLAHLGQVFFLSKERPSSTLKIWLMRGGRSGMSCWCLCTLISRRRGDRHPHPCAHDAFQGHVKGHWTVFCASKRGMLCTSNMES